MSILIKGMEMPEKCTYCPLVHVRADIDTGKVTVVCTTNHELLSDDWEGSCIDRPDWCPIGEVPTPYGRLIDADKLKKRFSLIAEDDWNKTTATSWATAFRDAIDLVDEAPTIIEAEG